MRFFRTAPSKPPSRLMRKADVGDTVVFRADADGFSAYHPHVGHEAEVVAVELYPLRNRRNSRAVYEVRCGCGTILHPRATEFNVTRQTEK
jgi:hypothetical protein